MRNWLLSFLLFFLPSCVTPTTQAERKVNYSVMCATALGHEMISGHFSHVEILDGGVFYLVASSGRHVIVNGYCLAIEMR